MKLVNISKTGDVYIVKTMHPVRVLGFNIITNQRSYAFNEKEEYWYELATGKKVSKKKRSKLNKWLTDHKKFIEKI